MLAACVFEIANASGKIPRVDIAQARFLSNFGSAEQIVGTRVAWIGHLVIAVVGGDVPWNFRRNAHKKFREPAEFFVGVIEPGNEQSDNLKPKSHRVRAANSFYDRLQTP